MYWAEALVAQNKDAVLKAAFAPMADALAKNETAIVNELNEVQGHPVNIGGYYQPNEKLVSEAMRPSKLLNGIIG